MECLAELNSPGYSLRLHSRGHVHGFAPHIIGDARFPDDTSNRRAAMNADPQCQPAITERRTFVDHLKHGKSKPTDPNRSSNTLSLQTADRHVAVAYRLDLLCALCAMSLAQCIKGAHKTVEIIDHLARRQVMGRACEVDEVGEKDA
jgi:hypothetical protein